MGDNDTNFLTTIKSLPPRMIMVALPSALVLIAYTAYVTLFSVQKTFYFQKPSVALHNIPGILLSLLGTALWIYLGIALVESTLPTSSVVPGYVAALDSNGFWAIFHLWLAAFLGNTITGFVMIPLLPDVDPSVKREFISLVICQLSFVPVIYGMLDPSYVSTMRGCCYAASMIGGIVASANLGLYMMDYAEGKSTGMCSGQYLVDEMDKQHQQRAESINGRHSSPFGKVQATFQWLYHDYVSISFTRGSQRTRMPANKIMMFIAFTLIFPFPWIACIASKLDTLHATFPPEHMNAVGIFLLLVLGTVGNLQVFHGTLVIRGKDTIQRGATMVATTTVLEVATIFSMYMQVQGGPQAFAAFVRCIFTPTCPDPLVVDGDRI